MNTTDTHTLAALVRYEMFAHEAGQVTAEEAKHGRWMLAAEVESTLSPFIESEERKDREIKELREALESLMAPGSYYRFEEDGEDKWHTYECGYVRRKPCDCIWGKARAALRSRV